MSHRIHNRYCSLVQNCIFMLHLPTRLHFFALREIDQPVVPNRYESPREPCQVKFQATTHKCSLDRTSNNRSSGPGTIYPPGGTHYLHKGYLELVMRTSHIIHQRVAGYWPGGLRVRGARGEYP